MADYLFDPYNTDNEQPVTVQSFSDLTYDESADVMWVLGRPDPVVLTGVRRYPKGTLVLVTLDAEESAWLESLLASGRVIGFKPTPESGLPAEMYLSIGKVVQKRVSRLVASPERLWSLEVQAVKAPEVSAP